jgi:ribosome-associated toxin RatA of RatAB toxin-antitoxin module
MQFWICSPFPSSSLSLRSLGTGGRGVRCLQTTNTIVIQGDPSRIFELAANIQDWPLILPHYRYVVVETQTERTKTARMGASRDGFPVKWRCLQELRPDDLRIIFTHIGGITRGMYVEWRLEPGPQGTKVTIFHELNYSIPVLGNLFAKYIVGRLFVHNIAGKTLKCIKERVESEARAG